MPNSAREILGGQKGTRAVLEEYLALVHLRIGDSDTQVDQQRLQACASCCYKQKAKACVRSSDALHETCSVHLQPKLGRKLILRTSIVQTCFVIVDDRYFHRAQLMQRSMLRPLKPELTDWRMKPRRRDLHERRQFRSTSRAKNFSEASQKPWERWNKSKTDQ
eukprot:1008214-Amphidinium_carterae.1